MKKQILNLNKKETQTLAHAIGQQCQIGDVILLYGDLGTGKTTFTQYLIQFLIGEINVPSPTFTLGNNYISENMEIWHYDLYRLNSLQEAQNLDLNFHLHKGMLIIEWPEKISQEYANDSLQIEFYDHDETRKNIKIYSKNSKWRNILT